MSQYPSPYNPPPTPPEYGYDFNYYQPQRDVLAPARRASTLLFVLGGLIVLPSLCCAGMGMALPAMMADQPAAFGDLTASHMTPQFLQRALVIAGGIGVFAGVAMIVLGRFVRRGGMGAAVTAIVLAALVVLYLLLNGVGLLVMSGRVPPAQVVLGVGITVIGLALFGLLIVWLVQAAMAASSVATMQSQYQQQYWEYQQQQQMYQSGQVAPPPPAPMPPSDDASPEDPTQSEETYPPRPPAPPTS